MNGEILKNGNKLTEDLLTFQLRNKSHPAFSYLYDHYAGALLNIIRNIINEEELATDILQQSFIKIWTNIQDFDPQKGRLFTWMVRISKNTAIDTLRSKTFEIRKRTDQFIETNYEYQCDSLLYQQEYYLIEKQIIKLPQKYRVVIELIYIFGYNTEETAEVLNIPIGTIKTRKRTAMQLLRKSLRIREASIIQLPKNAVAVK